MEQYMRKSAYARMPHNCTGYPTEVGVRVAHQFRDLARPLPELHVLGRRGRMWDWTR